MNQRLALCSALGVEIDLVPIDLLPLRARTPDDVLLTRRADTPG